jgi:hypothetical protein
MVVPQRALTQRWTLMLAVTDVEQTSLNALPPVDPGIIRPSRNGIEMLAAGAVVPAVLLKIVASCNNLKVLRLSVLVKNRTTITEPVLEP